jgi:Ca2+/Na+ antiporter
MVLGVSVALLAVLERELPRLMWIVGSIIILIMVVLSLSIFIKQIGIREIVQIDKLDPQ